MILTLWASVGLIAWLALALPLAIACGRAFAAGGAEESSRSVESAGWADHPLR